MQTITTIGLDIAKSVFQVHGGDAAARLQDLTKDYSCEAVISENIQKATDLNLANFAAHEVQVRGRQASVQVYTIKCIRMLQSALEL
jgi:predicted nucleotide-binding protein